MATYEDNQKNLELYALQPELFAAAVPVYDTPEDENYAMKMWIKKLLHNEEISKHFPRILKEEAHQFTKNIK